MNRRVFNLLAAISLVLFATSIVFWIRGERRYDCAIFNPSNPMAYSICSRKGALQFSVEQHADGRQFPRWECGTLGPSTEMDQLLAEENDDIVPLLMNIATIQIQPIGPSYFHSIAIPDWVIGLFFLAVPLRWLHLRFRHARRATFRLCACCGYDLRGTPNRCPECGKVPSEIS